MTGIVTDFKRFAVHDGDDGLLAGEVRGKGGGAQANEQQQDQGEEAQLLHHIQHPFWKYASQEAEIAF